ncbi:MAG: SMP-30/gluconolactonase/LRE family protein, partial [Pseudomonadota bacterium]
SLEYFMDEYLRLLPEYQNIELEKLDFKRFLFGFFPAYKDRVCHRAAGCMRRYNRRGRFIEKIKVSAPGVKYCTFGGKDMDTLFLVTAGSEDLTRTRRNVSLSSAILKFKPGVAGIQPYQFAG